MPDNYIKYWDEELTFKVRCIPRSLLRKKRYVTDFYDMKGNHLFTIKGDMYDPYLGKRYWRDQLKIEFDAIERKEEISKKEFI